MLQDKKGAIFCRVPREKVNNGHRAREKKNPALRISDTNVPGFVIIVIILLFLVRARVNRLGGYSTVGITVMKSLQ